MPNTLNKSYCHFDFPSVNHSEGHGNLERFLYASFVLFLKTEDVLSKSINQVVAIDKEATYLAKFHVDAILHALQQFSSNLGRQAAV